MDITKDTLPMTAFRNRSADMMRHLKETKRPVLLTVNGKATHLLDLAADANATEGIRQGQEDHEAGRTRSAAEVFTELRAEYGIPR